MTAVAPGPGPYEAAIASDERAAFRRALRKLTVADQLLVRGRLELSLSYDEVALAGGQESAEVAR